MSNSCLSITAPSLALVIASCLAMGQAALAQPHWPQFRGAGARGIASGVGLPDRWSATENVAWKRDIPGRGWSSPVVWGDHVFLTTVVNRGETEAVKKGLYFGGDRPEPPESEHQWMVYCLDLHTGQVLWERTVREGQPDSSIHLKSSFASETPVTDGQRVYCCFGNVGIFCFDFDGNELWRYELTSRETRYGWGTAASPVLHQGRLYYCNDNEQESALLALDVTTGREVWKVPRDEKSNWATPFVWQNDVRTEIVTPGTGLVRSYDLDGQLLWTLSGMSSITIATPYAVDGLLYVSSGYVMDPQRPIYAIKPGATGDISLQDEQTSNDFIAWSQPKAAPYNPSTLVYDGRLYVLYDRGMFACYDAVSGRELFGTQRLPSGGAFTSSPWAYDGKVFCLNEDGVTYVFQAGDTYQLLHTNPLADDDMGMATPAIVGDRLLIRTSARVYCIRQSTNPADSPEQSDVSTLPQRADRAAGGLAGLNGDGDERPAQPVWTSGSHTMEVDGIERTFILDVPNNLRAGAPLVLVFHGYTGNAESIRESAGFTPLADTHGFVAAYLQGTPDKEGKNFHNVGYAFHADSKVDDIQFARSLSARLVDDLNLNPEAVFATGMSNGGDMSYYLASQPDPFVRAIAPVAGTMMRSWSDRSQPAVRIPILHVHGTDDQTTRWTGDPENRDGWGAYLGVEDVLKLWIGRMGLEQATVVALPRLSEDARAVRLHRWATASDKSEIRLYEIEGGGHDWPAHLSDPSVSTAATIWEFFQSHLPD